MTENNIELGGGVVFWSLGDWSVRENLLTGFIPLGLEAFVPEPRNPNACLKDALEQVLGGPRTLVRPLAGRKGFTVVTETRGEDANEYKQDLAAVLDDNGVPHFFPHDDRANKALEAFNKQQGLLHRNQVSLALVKLVDTMKGTRLRPSGAIYWMPAHTLEEWQKVAKVVEGAGQGRANAVYLLRHRMDAEAVRAVRDAVVTEVQADAGRIHDEVMQGELGGRALESRRDEAERLRDKVRLYEELLDVGLSGLRQAVDRADQAAAAAMLLGSALPAELTMGETA